MSAWPTKLGLLALTLLLLIAAALTLSPGAAQPESQGQAGPTPTTEVAPPAPDTKPVVDATIPDTPEADILPEGSTTIPMASAHFEMAEYACTCPGYCDGWPSPMDPDLLATIEILRESLGAPVIITSGVRCPRYNAEVGGIEYSRHLRGHAADLYSPQIDIHTVAQVASTLGLTVITYYDQGFIHVENEK
ncbi:Peptidase M15 [Eubacterium aggregans]|uniref:Peptidase M15 n=1 Tax=Eubacterium aggregans TaxID=81409 RepID=A0A1H4AFN3_9FIRM|nr:D-Ala-D-Ala carboxypeptidase family metallohydrolase [Eubacterium aggregans]SEA34780.1 Peptidase M15 [Eubacterium aggregans]